MEMGDDTSASEDEGVRGAVVTLVEHREPTTASIGGGRDVEMHGYITKSRKRVVSKDTALKRGVKQARLRALQRRCRLRAPPAPSVAEHVGRSGGHERSVVASESARVCDPQWGDAPLVAPVVSP